MTPDDLYRLLESLGIERLKKSNENYMGCCPYHEELNPSWGISKNEPHFFGCFGCGAKGTLATLLRDHSKYSEKEIRRLCRLGDEDKQLPVLASIEVPKYLLDEDCLYAYQRPFRIYAYLYSRGIPFWLTTLAECAYDALDNRVIFPWKDHQFLVGVTGRSLDPNNPLKTLPYFNTKKGKHLYMPSSCLTPTPLVLVEGEIDALKVFASGHTNVAAIGFGHFTDAQALKIVSSGTMHVVSFTDDDETGERVYSVIKNKLREHVLVSRIDYSVYRKHYAVQSKLDAGAMSQEDIQDAIRRAVRKTSCWPVL